MQKEAAAPSRRGLSTTTECQDIDYQQKYKLLLEKVEKEDVRSGPMLVWNHVTQLIGYAMFLVFLTTPYIFALSSSLPFVVSPARVNILQNQDNIHTLIASALFNGCGFMWYPIYVLALGFE